MREKFSRSMRLHTKDDFGKVKKSNQKAKTPYFWGQFTYCQKNETVRIGIIATRKIGDAHERNRARRLVREMFRKNVPKIQSTVSMIILPRKAMLEQKFGVLEDEFDRFLGKLGVLK